MKKMNQEQIIAGRSISEILKDLTRKLKIRGLLGWKKLQILLSAENKLWLSKLDRKLISFVNQIILKNILRIVTIQNLKN